MCLLPVYGGYIILINDRSLFNKEMLLKDVVMHPPFENRVIWNMNNNINKKIKTIKHLVFALASLHSYKTQPVLFSSRLNTPQIELNTCYACKSKAFHCEQKQNIGPVVNKICKSLLIYIYHLIYP